MSNRLDKFTPQQRDAITSLGKSLLVSAAAGSGKTAVLAERCAFLVCDAPPPHRCDVDQLLVVTFTNAAASEMRQRIGQALHERQRDASEDSEAIGRQIALIDRAHISTLHGFCAWLLRQHFSTAGVDPNFATLADDEAVLLRNEVARDLFADRYRTDDSGEFQRFIDGYGDGEDENLAKQVIRTHDLLCSMIDRDRWIDEAQARVREAIEKPLVESQLGTELLALIRTRLADCQRRCRHGIEQLRRLGRDFAGYVGIASSLLAKLEAWVAPIDIDRLSAAISTWQRPRLPHIPNDVPGKARARRMITELLEELGAKGELFNLLRFNTEQWRDGLSRTLAPTRIFLELVREFAARYRDAKRELRAVDFADLEGYALSLLRDATERNRLAPSAIARGCRAQFKHVLVDEYQDINAVQDAILSLVSNDAPQTPDETSNLFCVGDVKQSIYGFRLAEPGRFIGRAARFSEDASAGCVIDLQKNFRSRAPLLASINELFRRLMTRQAADLEYDASQELIYGAAYPATSDGLHFNGAPVELHLLPKATRDAGNDHATDDEGNDLDRTEREASFVAHRIRELMGMEGAPGRQVCEKIGDALVPRPIQFKDIVILLRAMKVKSDDFAAQLSAAEIPVHSESAAGFFEAMEVRDILALLRLLDNQRQDVPMAAMLRSPLAGLPNPDDCLAQIRLAYPDAYGAAPFHQAVVRYAEDQHDDLAATLREILGQIREWRDAAHRRPLAELIWQIYDSTGYLAFCAGLANGQQRVANLIALHERAREFGTFERQGLGRFMEFLRTLEDESDLGQASLASQADDVVRIMSIHRSKGLEFPVVFLPDLGKGHNLMDSRSSILADRGGYLGLYAADEERQIRYPSLAWKLASERVRHQSLAEELRVLYVAMTRAREHLIMVGTAAPDAQEKWRDAWRDHRGPLPADEVLGASTMLSWIGPAVAAMADELPDAFDVRTYEQDEVNAWASELSKPAELTDKQKARANLVPLSPPPVADPLGQEVLERVSAKYQFDDLTKMPATRSVTGSTKQPPASRARGAPAPQSDLELPKFFHDTNSPIEIGSATHLVLEHLDFSAPSTKQALEKQLQQMIDRRLIISADMERVDKDGVIWLMQSELGEILRENASTLRREVSISLAEDGESSSTRPDPLDRAMIRGRIDALVARGAKLVIADYKTDRVKEPADIEARVEVYRPQMQAYRKAIESITGRRVDAAYLAFLTPRALRRVD